MVKVLVLLYSNAGRSAPMTHLVKAFEVFVLKEGRKRHVLVQKRSQCHKSVIEWFLENRRREFMMRRKK